MDDERGRSEKKMEKKRKKKKKKEEEEEERGQETNNSINFDSKTAAELRLREPDGA